ncbi:MAG: response regulator transcription factor [Chloroflexi bacterium]|nr:response regulator transcription factor [Chloroflexota bacterium]
MTAVRVLLVDDMREARRDLRTALTISGNIEIVGEAANGLEAVRLTESLLPDVVLMDLEMPVMDGYEATLRIKSRFRCKVIALTVHDYESARMKAQQSGVDAFLVKGAPVKTIVQTILKKE